MKDLEYENVKSDKIARILGIYTKLMNGGIVNKAEEARKYGVNERSIQRDIDDIREYFENETADIGFINSVIYDRSAKGYRLEQLYKTRLSNSEILAVCKILLDSRAFTKKEMLLLLGKLVESCVPQTNQKAVMDLISNEEFHYVEPRHHTVFIDKLWTLGQQRLIMQIQIAIIDIRIILAMFDKKSDDQILYAGVIERKTCAGE